MLTAWRKLHECDTSRPFGPWLRGIAARLVMAHYRQRKRAMMLCDDAVLEYLDRQIQYISERPGDSWEDRIATLPKCIEALPDLHRAAIKMRYLEDNTARDVATRLGISIEALKKRLQRARVQLLKCLQNHGILLGSRS
jgi:RNA polymerase sigma-70 factor (ECF subfamily)